MTEIIKNLILLANAKVDDPIMQDMIELEIGKRLHCLRRENADRNRGELNCQFIDWIINNEKLFIEKISDIYKVGNQKVKYTYYGMIYTILEWEGCYVRGRGKSEAPNKISYRDYCGKYLKLTDRFKSNNVRKTLAEKYSHNYYLDIARRENSEVINRTSIFYKLESVFAEILSAIKAANFI